MRGASMRGATDENVYGDMQAMGVHLFRGEFTGPRIGGPGVHQSGDPLLFPVYTVHKVGHLLHQ